MCGIIGYIGTRKFMSIAKQGLLNLEYRGYDSAGVAYFENNLVKIKKQKGDVNNLFKNVDLETETHCGIGHTRWATHGKPADNNSHPHQSEKGYFTIVHNGEIENYNQLKEQYLSGVTFKSNTDSEIVPNLIEFFYLQKRDVLDAIKTCVNLLKGSFALAILFSNEPNVIYYARNKSPLVIGIGDNEKFISSDIIGISDYCKKYAIIDNKSYGIITKSEIFNYSFSGDKRAIEIRQMPKSKFRNGKGEYPHYMLKEINEVPLAIKTTAEYYKKKNNNLEMIPQSFFLNIRQIQIIACGTSYHSGLVGEKYFKEIAGVDSVSKVASEFIYNKEIVDKQTLCIFISQSGETADTLSAIKKAKSLGAKTLGITNVATSSITTLCDYILPLNAGPEIAVASTKAYNCQLTVLLILAYYLQNGFKVNKKITNQLINTTKLINIDECRKSITPIVNKLSKSANIYMIGRDFDHITCMEGCLKLKEISYIPCEAYPAGELKHGTLALITNGVPVIAVITEEHLIDKTLMIASQIKARGGKVYIFTCFELSNYDISGMEVVRLFKLDDFLQPVFSIVPFQLLAYDVAISLGYDPDRPRNLAKSVTVE